MNKIYRLKLNSQGRMVVCSELQTAAAAHSGATKSEADLRASKTTPKLQPTALSKWLVGFSALMLGSATGTTFAAEPTVTVGSEVLDQVRHVVATESIKLVQGHTFNTELKSDRKLDLTVTGGTTIDWHGFSVKAGTELEWKRATDSSSAYVLNRVTGGKISEILGTVKSNDLTVLITNPAGVVIGKDGVLNAGDGAGFVIAAMQAEVLAATNKLKLTSQVNQDLKQALTKSSPKRVKTRTASKDLDLVIGDDTANASDLEGLVVNQGRATGNTTLVGQQVFNLGTISGDQVQLVAGNQVSIELGKNISVKVDPTNLVENYGSIYAKEATLAGNKVKNRGTIVASTTAQLAQQLLGQENQDGRLSAQIAADGTVNLVGLGDSQVVNQGRIRASQINLKGKRIDLKSGSDATRTPNANIAGQEAAANSAANAFGRFNPLANNFQAVNGNKNSDIRAWSRSQTTNTGTSGGQINIFGATAAELAQAAQDSASNAASEASAPADAATNQGYSLAQAFAQNLNSADYRQQAQAFVNLEAGANLVVTGAGARVDILANGGNLDGNIDLYGTGHLVTEGKNFNVRDSFRFTNHIASNNQATGVWKIVSDDHLQVQGRLGSVGAGQATNPQAGQADFSAQNQATPAQAQVGLNLTRNTNLGGELLPTDAHNTSVYAETPSAQTDYLVSAPADEELAANVYSRKTGLSDAVVHSYNQWIEQVDTSTVAESASATSTAASSTTATSGFNQYGKSVFVSGKALDFALSTANVALQAQGDLGVFDTLLTGKYRLDVVALGNVGFDNVKLALGHTREALMQASKLAFVNANKTRNLRIVAGNFLEITNSDFSVQRGLYLAQQGILVGKSQVTGYGQWHAGIAAAKAQELYKTGDDLFNLSVGQNDFVTAATRTNLSQFQGLNFKDAVLVQNALVRNANSADVVAADTSLVSDFGSKLEGLTLRTQVFDLNQAEPRFNPAALPADSGATTTASAGLNLFTPTVADYTPVLATVATSGQGTTYSGLPQEHFAYLSQGSLTGPAVSRGFVLNANQGLTIAGLSIDGTNVEVNAKAGQATSALDFSHDAKVSVNQGSLLVNVLAGLEQKATDSAASTVSLVGNGLVNLNLLAGAKADLPTFVVRGVAGETVGSLESSESSVATTSLKTPVTGPALALQVNSLVDTTLGFKATNAQVTLDAQDSQVSLSNAVADKNAYAAVQAHKVTLTPVQETQAGQAQAAQATQPAEFTASADSQGLQVFADELAVKQANLDLHKFSTTATKVTLDATRGSLAATLGQANSPSLDVTISDSQLAAKLNLAAERQVNLELVNSSLSDAQIHIDAAPVEQNGSVSHAENLAGLTLAGADSSPAKANLKVNLKANNLTLNNSDLLVEADRVVLTAANYTGHQASGLVGYEQGQRVLNRTRGASLDLVANSQVRIDADTSVQADGIDLVATTGSSFQVHTSDLTLGTAQNHQATSFQGNSLSFSAENVTLQGQVQLLEGKVDSLVTKGEPTPEAYQGNDVNQDDNGNWLPASANAAGVLSIRDQYASVIGDKPEATWTAPETSKLEVSGLFNKHYNRATHQGRALDEQDVGIKFTATNLSATKANLETTGTVDFYARRVNLVDTNLVGENLYVGNYNSVVPVEFSGKADVDNLVFRQDVNLTGAVTSRNLVVHGEANLTNAAVEAHDHFAVYTKANFSNSAVAADKLVVDDLSLTNSKTSFSKGQLRTLNATGSFVNVGSELEVTHGSTINDSRLDAIPRQQRQSAYSSAANAGTWSKFEQALNQKASNKPLVVLGGRNTINQSKVFVDTLVAENPTTINSTLRVGELFTSGNFTSSRDDYQVLKGHLDGENIELVDSQFAAQEVEVVAKHFVFGEEKQLEGQGVKLTKVADLATKLNQEAQAAQAQANQGTTNQGTINQDTSDQDTSNQGTANQGTTTNPTTGSQASDLATGSGTPSLGSQAGSTAGTAVGSVEPGVGTTSGSTSGSLLQPAGSFGNGGTTGARVSTPTFAAGTASFSTGSFTMLGGKFVANNLDVVTNTFEIDKDGFNYSKLALRCDYSNATGCLGTNVDSDITSLDGEEKPAPDLSLLLNFSADSLFDAASLGVNNDDDDDSDDDKDAEESDEEDQGSTDLANQARQAQDQLSSVKKLQQDTKSLTSPGQTALDLGGETPLVQAQDPSIPDYNNPLDEATYNELIAAGVAPQALPYGRSDRAFTEFARPVNIAGVFEQLKEQEAKQVEQAPLAGGLFTLNQHPLQAALVATNASPDLKVQAERIATNLTPDVAAVLLDDTQSSSFSLLKRRPAQFSDLKLTAPVGQEAPINTAIPTKAAPVLPANRVSVGLEGGVESGFKGGFEGGHEGELKTSVGFGVNVDFDARPEVGVEPDGLDVPAVPSVPAVSANAIPAPGADLEVPSTPSTPSTPSAQAPDVHAYATPDELNFVGGSPAEPPPSAQVFGDLHTKGQVEQILSDETPTTPTVNAKAIATPKVASQALALEKLEKVGDEFHAVYELTPEQAAYQAQLAAQRAAAKAGQAAQALQGVTSTLPQLPHLEPTASNAPGKLAQTSQTQVAQAGQVVQASAARSVEAAAQADATQQAQATTATQTTANQTANQTSQTLAQAAKTGKVRRVRTLRLTTADLDRIAPTGVVATLASAEVAPSQPEQVSRPSFNFNNVPTAQLEKLGFINPEQTSQEQADFIDANISEAVQQVLKSSLGK